MSAGLGEQYGGETARDQCAFFCVVAVVAINDEQSGKWFVLVFTLQSHTLVKFGKDILSICKHLENFLFSFPNTISGVSFSFVIVFVFIQQNMNVNTASFFYIQFATCLRQFRCYSIDLFAVYFFVLFFIPSECSVSISNYFTFTLYSAVFILLLLLLEGFFLCRYLSETANF